MRYNRVLPLVNSAGRFGYIDTNPWFCCVHSLLASLLLRIPPARSARLQTYLDAFAKLASMTASFALVDATTANTRQTDDALNGVAGGCAAGFLAGIRRMFL